MRYEKKLRRVCRILYLVDMSDVGMEQRVGRTRVNSHHGLSPFLPKLLSRLSFSVITMTTSSISCHACSRITDSRCMCVSEVRD